MKLLEFFNGNMSVSRLLHLLSFFPASYVMIRLSSESALGIYLTAYVTSYLGGKGIDLMPKKKK